MVRILQSQPIELLSFCFLPLRPKNTSATTYRKNACSSK
uniref:Uncharacterized protein n=1 Tax=Rhizophora mucronata TaxID=61149 RepID=A0A2P2PUC9_RHIMU